MLLHLRYELDEPHIYLPGCVKKCMEYEVDGARPRGRSKNT